MRPVQFSGFPPPPPPPLDPKWGNAKLMVDASDFEPKTLKKGIEKIGTPFQAPEDCIIFLHRVGGNQAADVHVGDKLEEGFHVEHGKSDYMKILTQVAQYMTGKFPKN